MAASKRRTPARRAPAVHRRRSGGKREVATSVATQTTSLKSDARSGSNPLTIVAIGASAGGMEAISRLFRNITGATNMAFVVVQHLSPRYESLLPELLGSSSTLPVVQVTEGMPLLADRVHVIPPDVQMTVIRRQDRKSV